MFIAYAGNCRQFCSDWPQQKNNSMDSAYIYNGVYIPRIDIHSKGESLALATRVLLASYIYALFNR